MFSLFPPPLTLYYAFCLLPATTQLPLFFQRASALPFQDFPNLWFFSLTLCTCCVLLPDFIVISSLECKVLEVRDFSYLHFTTQSPSTHFGHRNCSANVYELNSTEGSLGLRGTNGKKFPLG